MKEVNETLTKLLPIYMKHRPNPLPCTSGSIAIPTLRCFFTWDFIAPCTSDQKLLNSTSMQSLLSDSINRVSHMNTINWYCVKATTEIRASLLPIRPDLRFFRDGPFDIQGGGLGFFLATSYFFLSFCTTSYFFQK